MMQKVFGVYDSKVNAYLQPFFSESAGGAIRAFADVSNDRQSPIGRHPGDYQLYELGTFDTSTGMLVALIPMRLLGCALDFVNPVEPPRVQVEKVLSEVNSDER